MTTLIIKIGLDLLQPSIILKILTLMIPIALLFAALLLILSIYAKSFKEAQSIITPLNISLFFPIYLGIMPGIHLNMKTKYDNLEKMVLNLTDQLRKEKKI